MNFNSFVFAGFFLVVYAGYLFLRGSWRAQNRLLLAASLIFYGAWDWRFLLLLLGTAGMAFFIALRIEKTHSPARRRAYLALAVVSLLTVLGFFKYFNFFAASLAALLGLFGSVHDVTLAIVLPIGISFYTFLALGYTLDVYRGTTPAASSLPDFLLYVTFFPQLVAGPIACSSRLLPQILSPREVRVAQVDAGLFLLLWGYFKKVVIADNCALIANQVFDGYARYQGLDLVLGVLAFSVQVFCDFSGYSDIARGLAKLMGFDLMINFKLPYFALSPADFWRRWHISLSTWLRDYLFFPLADLEIPFTGKRGSKARTYRNVGLTMLACGLWHGAAWNYVLWGAYHGALLILSRALGWEDVVARLAGDGPGTVHGRRPAGLGRGLGAVALGLSMAFTFALTAAGWVIFRARSCEQIVYMLSHAGLGSSAQSAALASALILYAAPLLIVQAHQAYRGDLLSCAKLPGWVRVPVYAALVTGLLVFGARNSIEFIYFQF